MKAKAQNTLRLEATGNSQDLRHSRQVAMKRGVEADRLQIQISNDAAILLTALMVVKRQRRAAQSDAVDLPVQHSCGNATHMIQDKLDTRRTAVDGQHARRVFRHDVTTPDRAVFPGWRIPASLVRLSINAFIATISVLPDIESAATSGLSTNG